MSVRIYKVGDMFATDTDGTVRRYQVVSDGLEIVEVEHPRAGSWDCWLGRRHDGDCDD